MINKLNNLIALSFIIFIDTLSYYIVIPILFRIIIHDHAHIVLNLNHMQRNILFGFAIALSPLVGLLTAPWLGYFSDLYGRKKVLLICLGGSILAFLLPIVGIDSKSIILILLGRALAGASDCGQAIAQAAIADNTQGKQKAYQMGIILFAVSSGLIVGPLLGSLVSDHYLVSWFDISTPYFIGLALSLFNIVLLLEFFQESPLKTTKIKNKPNFLFNWKKLGQEPEIRLCLIMFFCVQFSWAMYYQNNYTYLTEVIGFSTRKLGEFSTIIGIGIAASLAFVYPFTVKWLTLKTSYRISILLMLIGLCVALIPSLGMQWVALLPLSIAGGVSYATGISIISNFTSIGQQGWIMGLLSSLIALAWLLSGFLPSLLLNFSTYLPLSLAIVAMSIAFIISLNAKSFSSSD